jgi:hypothetical protein
MGDAMAIVRLLFDQRRALAAAVLLGCAGAPAATLGARLRARLPDPWNGNRHVTVVTDAPAPPRGTPLLRIEPALAVIGVVEGAAPDAATPVTSDAAVRVSIFPEAQGLLRDDSRIELRETTPDLLEIVARHFTAERRARLAHELEAWRAAHEEAIDRALARVREIAERELGADELGRKLYEDEAIRGAVAGALERDVIDPIDWNAVVERAVRSDAASSTGAFLKHAGPITSSWAGLRAGYRARWTRAFGAATEGGGSLAAGGGRTLEALRAGDVDEAALAAGGTIADAIDRADARRLALDPQGWILDRTFALFTPDPRAFGDAALRRAGQNLVRAFPKEKERLARDYAALGRDLGSDVGLGAKSFDALRAIASDRALRDDVARRYGPEARARVDRFFAALAADEVLGERARAVLDSGLELAAGTLRELALDDAGTGPNPLLVAFIREKLRGHAETVLILRSSGAGEPAPEGERYVARRR